MPTPLTHLCFAFAFALMLSNTMRKSYLCYFCSISITVRNKCDANFRAHDVKPMQSICALKFPLGNGHAHTTHTYTLYTTYTSSAT